MSAKRSQWTKAVKRAGEMAQRYESRIAQQKETIDRLVLANAAQGDALFAIANDAKNVKEARVLAQGAIDKVKVILAVPKEEASA